MNDEQKTTSLRTLANVAVKKTEKCLVCIYGMYMDEDKVIQHSELLGTALLIRVEDKDFMITAKHVLDFRNNEKYFDLGTNAGNSGQNLLKFITEDSEIAFSDDRDDVAVIKLLPHHSEKIKEYGQFVPLGLNELNPFYKESENDAALMIGFPVDMSEPTKHKPGVISTGLPYASFLTKTGLGEEPSYNSGRDILLKFDMEETVDERNLPATIIEPFGISGGPIWIFQPKNQMWSPEDVRVIGVCKEWYDSKKIVCATRVWVVFDTIAEKWPELSDAITNQF